MTDIISESISDVGESIPVDYDKINIAPFNIEDFETKVRPIEIDEPMSFIKGTSKFILTPEAEAGAESLLKDIKKDKKSKKGMALVDSQSPDIIKVSKKRKKKFIENLHLNSNELKSYIVDEVIPYILSLEKALDDCDQELELILGFEVNVPKKAIQSMFLDSFKLKLFEHLAKKLALTEKQKRLIMKKYFDFTVTRQVSSK